VYSAFTKLGHSHSRATGLAHVGVGSLVLPAHRVVDLCADAVLGGRGSHGGGRQQSQGGHQQEQELAHVYCGIVSKYRVSVDGW
jgi:hypothetical protein